MPTREEITAELVSTDAGGDTEHAAPQQVILEQLNGAIADVDDELEALANKLAWLSTVTWTNERPVAEFGAFVEAKITECEARIVSIRQRWQKEWSEQNPNKNTIDRAAAPSQG